MELNWLKSDASSKIVLKEVLVRQKTTTGFYDRTCLADI